MSLTKNGKRKTRKKMKAGLFAGGAGWGAWTVGVHTTLRKPYDVFIGTSTGAIIALFLALGRIDSIFYDLLVYEYSNITNRQMYGLLSPYNRRGKISKPKVIAAIVRMMYKERNHIYDIGEELYKRLSKRFTYNHFLELRRQKIDVIVTVNCVSLKNEPTQYVSVLDPSMTYERFKLSVVASASIPYAAKPVVWNNLSHLDGGVFDTAPTGLINKYQDPDIWLMHSLQSEQKSYREVDGWLKLAGALFSGMRAEIKRDDLKGVRGADVYYASSLNGGPGGNGLASSITG
jgi:predicted acylesterase/phospholipase RssA